MQGKVALTCGPLVYCLESCDNPGVDIFNAVLEPATVRTSFSLETLGGSRLIYGKTVNGENLVFIPYHLWGNHGESKMTVFVNTP